MLSRIPKSPFAMRVTSQGSRLPDWLRNSLQDSCFVDLTKVLKAFLSAL